MISKAIWYRVVPFPVLPTLQFSEHHNWISVDSISTTDSYGHPLVSSLDHRPALPACRLSALSRSRLDRKPSTVKDLLDACHLHFRIRHLPPTAFAFHCILYAGASQRSLTYPLLALDINLIRTSPYVLPSHHSGHITYPHHLPTCSVEGSLSA